MENLTASDCNMEKETQVKSFILALINSAWVVIRLRLALFLLGVLISLGCVSALSLP